MSSTRMNHYPSPSTGARKVIGLSFPCGGVGGGMRTINPWCVVVVVVILHQGMRQIIVIRSERAWWQPLSWSERA